MVLRSMSNWLALATQPAGRSSAAGVTSHACCWQPASAGDEHPPGGEGEGGERHDEGSGREDAGRACRRGGLIRGGWARPGGLGARGHGGGHASKDALPGLTAPPEPLRGPVLGPGAGVSVRASGCSSGCAPAPPGRAPRAAAAGTRRSGRGSPLRVPYQPPTGLASDRPQASTVPSGAGFCSSAPPSGTQSPCSPSHAARSSMARRWYLSCVLPTWHTRTGRVGGLVAPHLVRRSTVGGDELPGILTRAAACHRWPPSCDAVDAGADARTLPRPMP